MTGLLETPAVLIITLLLSWGRKENAELFRVISLEGRDTAHLTCLFPVENEQPASLALAGKPGKVACDFRSRLLSGKLQHHRPGPWIMSLEMLNHALF